MSKVKIQGNASGTGVVTLTAPNTNTDRTITLPDEDITLGGGVDGIVSSANATAITIDANENVGLGVVPESGWHSTQWDVLQMGLGGSYSSYASGAGVSSAQVASNMYATLGSSLSGYKYIRAEAATSYYQYSGNHYFRVAPSGTADSAISWTTAMTIQNDGDVEMGTTSNSSSLNVYNDNGAKPGIVIRDIDSSPTYSNRFIRFQKNDGAEIGYIGAQGSSVAYVTSSDYRLKENVVPMTGSIDRLKQLKPSRFNFIADADTTVDGFLAHEAQEVVPEAVSGEKDAMRTEEYEVTPAVEATYDEDGNVLTEAVEAVMGEREVEDYQGIDQAKLVPLLTSALQEAVAKIEALEARVTQLENN